MDMNSPCTWLSRIFQRGRGTEVWWGTPSQHAFFGDVTLGREAAGSESSPNCCRSRTGAGPRHEELLGTCPLTQLGFAPGTPQVWKDT